MCFNTIATDHSTHIKMIMSDGTLAHNKVYKGPLLQAIARCMRLCRGPLHAYCPVVGAGRFSATRTAVTVANALAFARRARAVAIPHELWDNDKALWQVYTHSRGKYASARYSGEPTITKPRNVTP